MNAHRFMGSERGIFAQRMQPIGRSREFAAPIEHIDAIPEMLCLNVAVSSARQPACDEFTPALQLLEQGKRNAVVVLFAVKAMVGAQGDAAALAPRLVAGAFDVCCWQELGLNCCWHSSFARDFTRRACGLFPLLV